MADTVEEVARRIAEGHCFEEHVVKAKEFKDSALGHPMDIETREDLRAHAVNVLKSRDTLSFTGFTGDPDRQADFFYHAPSNTMIVVPHKLEDEPTLYRPWEGPQVILEKKRESEVTEDRAIPIAFSHGIYELHPDMRIEHAEIKTTLPPEEVAELRKSLGEERQAELPRFIQEREEARRLREQLEEQRRENELRPDRDPPEHER